jgi:hypothetical protein
MDMLLKFVTALAWIWGCLMALWGFSMAFLLFHTPNKEVLLREGKGTGASSEAIEEAQKTISDPLLQTREQG